MNGLALLCGTGADKRSKAPARSNVRVGFRHARLRHVVRKAASVACPRSTIKGRSPSARGVPSPAWVRVALTALHGRRWSELSRTVDRPSLTRVGATSLREFPSVSEITVPRYVPIAGPGPASERFGGGDVPLFPKPPRRMTGTGPVVGQRAPPHSPHYGRSPIPIITVQQRKRCLRDGSARFRSKLGTGIRDASLRAFWPSGRVQDAARVPAQQGEKSCKKYLLQRSNFCYIDCVLTSRACATTANACTS